MDPSGPLQAIRTLLNPAGPFWALLDPAGTYWMLKDPCPTFGTLRTLPGTTGPF
jgi:hypothetical protein